LRKVILTALCLICIFSLIFGCQSKDNVSNATSDLKSVSVSKPDGSNEITFDDKESLKAFQNIFNSAVKEPGIVDMAPPEFYLEAIYDKENHPSFYLWIGEKGYRSTLMKTEDTHTIYTVSEEKTDKLIELVKSRFN